MGEVFSLIVPVYNEEQRIHNVSKIVQFVRRQPKKKFELIFVNDGSTDGTLKSLRVFQKKFPFRILTYEKNRGKGYAIRRGMLAAHGKWRVFFDLDLSVPLTTLRQLEKQYQRFDVIVGTRRLRTSRVLIHQDKWRETFGKVFTFFCQRWLNVSYSDFTCGFKCFSKKATERIFSLTYIQRWGFDAEILFLARLLSFKVKELPVKWKNDPQTKVRFFTDTFGSFLDVLEIRYHFLRGRYD